MTATDGKAEEVFDRQFVIAATLIGAAYAGVVVGLASIVGKEAAGAAGVALTALATAVFKQFESLRFRRSEAAMVFVTLPRLDYSVLALVTLAFNGSQVVFGMIGAVVADKVGILTPELSFSNSEINLLLVFTGLSFLATGAVAGRASEHAPGLTYTYVTIGSLLAIVMSLSFLLVIVGWANAWELLAQPNAAFSLLWVALSLIGGYVGVRARRRSTTTIAGAVLG